MIGVALQTAVYPGWMKVLATQESFSCVLARRFVVLLPQFMCFLAAAAIAASQVVMPLWNPQFESTCFLAAQLLPHYFVAQLVGGVHLMAISTGKQNRLLVPSLVFFLVFCVLWFCFDGNVELVTLLQTISLISTSSGFVFLVASRNLIPSWGLPIREVRNQVLFSLLLSWIPLLLANFSSDVSGAASLAVAIIFALDLVKSVYKGQV
jgi:hypothetical protein